MLHFQCKSWRRLPGQVRLSNCPVQIIQQENRLIWLVLKIFRPQTEIFDTLRKPSLEVAPTTLSKKNSTINKNTSRQNKETYMYKIHNLVTYIYSRKATVFSERDYVCLLYTSPSPRDGLLSRMPSSA